MHLHPFHIVSKYHINMNMQGVVAKSILPDMLSIILWS